MEWRELIVDGYDRLPEMLEDVLRGLRPADLDWQPHPDCNSIGWTTWHLIRVQDGQLADLMGEPSLWVRDGWHKKFGRPPDPEDSGYRHTAAQVRAFRSPSARTQLDYLRATVERTKQYLGALSAAELDRALDEPWFQPLPTVGVRLVSILTDCHLHAGEASYIRGLLKTRRKPARPRAARRAVRPAARKRPAKRGKR